MSMLGRCGALLFLLLAVLTGCTVGVEGLSLPSTSPEVTPVTQVEPTSLPSVTPPVALPQLLFVSKRDGDEEIYRMNVDGSGLLRLTATPGPDTAPAWSPDSGTVAFVALAEDVEQIFLMHPDGTARHQLTALPGGSRWPSWSPDGRRIAFANCMGDEQAVATIELVTGKVSFVLTDLVDLGRVAWSSDGRSIIYSARTVATDVTDIYLFTL
ncbi:MAG: hypothetical protein EOM24_07295, partial [Chloroflexia bacterium]|nr:hypothetical protein [Chloroflexia bacterium]